MPALTTPIIAATALGYFTLAFLAHFFLQGSKWTGKLATRLAGSPDVVEWQVYVEKTLGFILFGLIPAIIFPLFSYQPLNFYGVSWPNGSNFWLWFLGPVILFLMFSLLRTTSSINTSYYPQVRKSTWDVPLLLRNGLFWVLYLIGYEFIFRGLLFFSCHAAFGFWPAVMINCAVYSLSHIPKGASETFAAFFAGILFCWLAFHTNSMLIPFLLHVILALGNDLRAISENKDMRFSFTADQKIGNESK